MSDTTSGAKPVTDRHDRVTARLDALEAAHRAGLEQVRALRQEVDALSASQEDGQRDLAELRTELRGVVAGQGTLAEEVGTLRMDMRGLVGQITALSGRVPTGQAVMAAGAGAGVPSVILLAWQVAQAMGWLGAQ